MTSTQVSEQTAKRTWLLQSQERAKLLVERKRITANEVRQEVLLREAREEVRLLIHLKIAVVITSPKLSSAQVARLNLQLEAKQKEVERLKAANQDLSDEVSNLEKNESESRATFGRTHHAFERSNVLLQERFVMEFTVVVHLRRT